VLWDGMGQGSTEQIWKCQTPAVFYSVESVTTMAFGPTGFKRTKLNFWPSACKLQKNSGFPRSAFRLTKIRSRKSGIFLGLLKLKNISCNLRRLHNSFLKMPPPRCDACEAKRVRNLPNAWWAAVSML